jgi:hypothetical protein
MEKSPYFKPKQCALLIDHEVGATQLIKNGFLLTAYGR